jgi:hypothetical protein
MAPAHSGNLEHGFDHGNIEEPTAVLVEQSQQLTLDESAVPGGASPQSPIYEDLRNYEFDDEAYGDLELSSSGSSSSSSSGSASPTTEHVEHADEEPVEFPIRAGPSVSGIQVTNTVSIQRSPLPFFKFPERTSPPSMPNPKVPKPGPAKLSPRAGLDEWLAEAKQCHYLPEAVMKQLCEMVKECLMEGEQPRPSRPKPAHY